jgi:hypothetical protein
VHHGRSERGQCWDHQANRRLDYDVCRSPRLEPDAIVESIGDARVVNGNGSTWQVADDSAPVGIHMIVPMPDIAMLAVRLDLIIGQAFLAVLRINVGWIEMRHTDRGEQAGNQSHGSSPLPGDGMERTGPDR